MTRCLSYDFSLATYRISQIPEVISRDQLPHLLSSIQDLQPPKYANTLNNIMIHSLASRVGLSNPTKTATVTFREIPSILLDKRTQWTCTFVHMGNSGTLVIDTHFDGFTVLNEVEEENYVLEYVFPFWPRREVWLIKTKLHRDTRVRSPPVFGLSA